MANVKCPFCGSETIYRFQRDHDGSDGSYYAYVNAEECYNVFSSKIPDVDVYHCGSCNSFFDPAARYQTKEVVPLSSLQEAISNIENHIQWLTKNYKASCQSVRLKIEKGTHRDMGTTIARQFPDLVKAYEEIEKFNEQAKLLSHIIDKLTVSIPTVIAESQEMEVE